MNICDLSLDSEGWKMPRPSYEPATEDVQKQEMSHEACPSCITMRDYRKQPSLQVLLTKALIIVFPEDAKMDP